MFSFFHFSADKKMRRSDLYENLLVFKFTLCSFTVHLNSCWLNLSTVTNTLIIKVFELLSICVVKAHTPLARLFGLAKVPEEL